MPFDIFKIVVTTFLVVLVSEISKRSTLAAGILASLPIVSVLAMIWLYVDTRDAAQAASLATSVFWLVIPSLALFLVFPLMISRGFAFSTSLATSVLATIGCYYGMIAILGRLGIRL